MADQWSLVRGTGDAQSRKGSDMPDTAPGGADAPRLYSQTACDERGNFVYRGDLRRDAERVPALCERIGGHLAAHFPTARFAVRSKTFAGGRSVTVELLDIDLDLTDRTVRDDVELRVLDQVQRFGFTRSNVYQDFHTCSFYAHVEIGRSYWTALAARRVIANPVEPTLPLARFKQRLKPGDALRLVHSSRGGRFVGSTRTVVAVRSKDLILDGPSYLDFPRAAGFACDGRLVRIALGDEHDPDDHLLYEWLPRSAADER